MMGGIRLEGSEKVSTLQEETTRGDVNVVTVLCKRKRVADGTESKNTHDLCHPYFDADHLYDGHVSHSHVVDSSRQLRQISYPYRRMTTSEDIQSSAYERHRLRQR
jgi:hypothetical protein